MDFTLPPLPYEKDALEPFLSADTVSTHYGKHHAGYLKKLDKALEGSPLRDKTLTEIMLEVEGGTFNLAAQVWNHNFYWLSLSPERQSLAEGELSGLVNESFGGVDKFFEKFAEVAANEFGSGWAWLVFDPDGQKLDVVSTTDAVNPLLDGQIPLLTLDVWEHAYYLDYKNDRGAYIAAFLDAHVNWQFAQDNLAEASKRAPLK